MRAWSRAGFSRLAHLRRLTSTSHSSITGHPRRHETRTYAALGSKQEDAASASQSLLQHWLELGLLADINGHQQHLALKTETLPIGSEGEEFTVVYPADVDASIDMYISQVRVTV